MRVMPPLMALPSPRSRTYLRRPFAPRTSPPQCRRIIEMAGKGGFFESLLSGILGDSQRPDADRPELGVPMLADWLPYRSFDAKTGVFYNSASRGFVIEAAPLIGADERTGERSEEHTSEVIPAQGCLQDRKSVMMGKSVAGRVEP